MTRTSVGGANSPAALSAEPFAIVGAGYVGLVTGVCLAASGRRVTLVEVDAHRRKLIANGQTPIFEPGLAALLRRTIDSDSLTVEASLKTALQCNHLVVVAVGTPALPDGRADM
ncbi:MAG: hypothetical protein ACRDX8_08315, partial [Acidimicrobiales bacterium]